MIYLGKSSYYDEELGEFMFLLKIGYTDDSNRDKRLLSYTSHNPGFKFIIEIPKGTELHESYLLNKFGKYLHHGNEWFEYSEKIVEYFKSISLEKIEQNPDFGTISKCRYLQAMKGLTSQVIFMIESMLDKVEILNFNLGNINKYFKLIDEKRLTNLDNIYEVLLNSFSEFSTLPTKLPDEFLISKVMESSIEVKYIWEELDKFTTFPNKMKFLCDFVRLDENKKEFIRYFPEPFKNYILVLGIDKILGYSCRGAEC